MFGRRQGRVIAAESAGFGGQFLVLATLPVPESFHLASELRTQTSGLASPQLVFSHWEVSFIIQLHHQISAQTSSSAARSLRPEKGTSAVPPNNVSPNNRILPSITL